MATVEQWTPFDVALDVTATSGGVTRTSATQYTVKINASWKTHWDGAQTNFAMSASSGGSSVNLNKFGTKSSSGSGSFTGTYSISGNGSATKTITVTFKNWEEDWQGTITQSKTQNVTFNVTVPAWTSYTVSYNANGGSGAPSSQTKWKDQTLTLSSTKPTRSGYTFVGWGTSTTDTSANYSAGGSYTANASDTLYAIWSKTITLSYNANGGSGAPSSQSATIYNATTNKAFTISSTKPTRTGYTFLGWSTSSTATSASYSSGSSITLSNSDTLYAVWSINSYYIDINGYLDGNAIDNITGFGTVDIYVNGSLVSSGISDYYAQHPYGSTYEIKNIKPATGHTYNGVNSGSISGTVGTSNVSVRLNFTTNVYTINYNVNGGDSSMNSQTIAWNEVFTPADNTSKREGYKFIGWNAYRHSDSKWHVSNQGWLTDGEIASGGYKKKLYNTQEPLTFNNYWIEGNESVISQYTMYAVWEISGVVYIDNGIELVPYLTYIDNGTGWDLYLAYIDDGVDWKIIS